MQICRNVSFSRYDNIYRLFLSLLIGFLPDLRKYCQRTICKKTHKKETFIWIYYINFTHSSSEQNALNLIKEMLISVKRIIILHFLRYDKKL